MIRTFRRSPPTVGVELEWQLIDRGSLDLREGIVPLVELLPNETCVKPELVQTAVETVTPPAENTEALRPWLRDVVERLVDAAARCGIALVGAGTHAFCERLVPVTPLPRFADLERSQGYLTHVCVAYSLRAHVGMPSPEVAIRVMRDMRPFLPVLLALSASSPFFHGCETRFVSYRHRMLASTRSSGMPPTFEDWHAFLHFLDIVERADMFGSFRDMHWDARLRPDLGTIEVRIMDAQPTLTRSLALAALVHSLLAHLASKEEVVRFSLPPLPWWLEKENAFRASHEGVDASLICATDGTVKPLRRVAEELFDLVTPTARALGELEDLARARAILAEGPCYVEERAAFGRTGSMKGVVRALANELLDELGKSRLDAR